MEAGAMISDAGGPVTTVLDKCDKLNRLCVNETRDSQSMAFKEKNKRVDAYIQNGKTVILTIQNGGGHYSPDLRGFKEISKRIMVCCPAAYYVIENEENNLGRNADGVQAYIPELDAAIEAAHELGCSITNGGLIMKPLNYIVYRQMVACGNPDADRFLQTIPEKERTTLLTGRSKGKEKLISDTLYLLDYYSKSDLDAINFHPYCTDVWAVEKVIEYLKQYGKPLLTNECGLREQNGPMLIDFYTMMQRNGLLHAIYYTAANVGWKLERDGILTENGNAIKEFILTT